MPSTKLSLSFLSVAALTSLMLLVSIITPTHSLATDPSSTRAYLQITLSVEPADRGSAAGVFEKYRMPFLSQIEGATSKDLLVRDDDVQVLHGFVDSETAARYLESPLFARDVVEGLKPYLAAAPEVRIYQVVSEPI